MSGKHYKEATEEEFDKAFKEVRLTAPNNDMPVQAGRGKPGVPRPAKTAGATKKSVRQILREVDQAESIAGQQAPQSRQPSNPEETTEEDGTGIRVLGLDDGDAMRIQEEATGIESEEIINFRFNLIRIVPKTRAGGIMLSNMLPEFCAKEDLRCLVEGDDFIIEKKTDVEYEGKTMSDQGRDFVRKLVGHFSKETLIEG